LLEALDHVIQLNERRLRRLLREFEDRIPMVYIRIEPNQTPGTWLEVSIITTAGAEAAGIALTVAVVINFMFLATHSYFC